MRSESREASSGPMLSGGPVDKIAVLDFGSQYTQLIARRIRELSVYSEIFAWSHPIDEILQGGFKGVILSGGPSSVYEENAPLPPKRLFEAGGPRPRVFYGIEAVGVPPRRPPGPGRRG